MDQAQLLSYVRTDLPADEVVALWFVRRRSRHRLILYLHPGSDAGVYGPCSWRVMAGDIGKQERSAFRRHVSIRGFREPYFGRLHTGAAHRRCNQAQAYHET